MQNIPLNVGSENYSGKHPNESFPIKWKLFKYYLKVNNIEAHLYMPKNQTHVDECIAEILKTIYGKENNGRKTIL